MNHLLGRSYGPVTYEVTRRGVEAFVDATADDRDRWIHHAPPGYAGAVLFSVAPAFLSDPDVAPLTRSVIHTDQRFTWERPLPVGERLEVTGEVTSVRERGPIVSVSFDVGAGSDSHWMESTSTFVLSGEAAAAVDEEPEPPHDARGPADPLVGAAPTIGELTPLRRSASRADLLRYAAATGDWNPIHWDHAAARAAGLGGVIVHGLLAASWLAQAAARYSASPAPLASMRIRFRRALRPAVAATIVGRAISSDPSGAELDLALVATDRRLITATARVTG